MRISRLRFVTVFVISAFVFQFITNSLLGTEVRLFPFNSQPFPGGDSAEGWKYLLATIIYPIKFILIGPLLPLFKLPDPPPPMLVLACAVYWALLALVIYELVRLVKKLRK